MADDLDYLLSWQPGQPLDRPQSAGVNAQGVYQNFNYKDRLKDTQYLNDLRGFFAERGVNDKTDEELDDMLHNSANYRDLNTVGAFFGAYGSQADLAKNSKTDEAMLRASRLHVAMQNAPTIFNEEGRDVSEALPSIVGAIVTDPINWGLGAIEAATGGLASPAVAGARAGITMGARAGLTQAAKFGAIEGAVTGVISDYGQQSIEQDLGLIDEKSTARMLESGVSSAALSAGIGGVFGALGGAIGGFRGQRTVDGLKAKGYTEAEIGSMLDGGMDGLKRLQQIEPDVYRQMIEDAKQAEIDAASPPADPIKAAQNLADSQREIRIASHLGPLNDHLGELRQKLSNLRADNEVGIDGVGELDDQINETLDQIANLEAVRQFPASVERRQKIIDEMLSDPDQAKRAKGVEMVRQLAEDRARFEEVMSSNVPEDVASFVNDRISNNQVLAEGRRFEQEDLSLDEAARRAALKKRQSIMAKDATNMATAEGVVAKDSGELAARTDSATKNQARLTGEQVSSADADAIIEEDALAQEAKALEAEDKLKAEKLAAEAAATEQVAEQVPAEQPVKPGVKISSDKAVLEQPGAVAEETPVAKMPVTASVTQTPIKSSKKAKARAVELGVDLQDVKGTGTDGRVLAEDVDAHIATNGVSETFLNSVGQLIEVMQSTTDKLKGMNVPDEKISAMVNDPEVFQSILVNYNRDIKKGAYSEDDIAALMDVYRSQLGDGTNFKAPSAMPDGIKIADPSAIKTAKSDEAKPEIQTTGELKPRDKEERSLYQQKVEQYTQAGFDPAAAHRAAGYDVYDARKKQTKDDVQSLDPRMQKASPIPVNAEGNPLIKLQSFLKPGRAFADKAAADGSSYSIQGAVPNVAMFHFEKARTLAARSYELTEKLAQIELKLGRKLTPEEILSERSLNKKDLAQIQSGDDDLATSWDEVRKLAKVEGRAFNRSPVMPFIAKGFERVRDAKTRPNKGDVLYVSGKTGKTFLDWRNAAKDAGLPSDGEQPASLVEAMSGMRSALANKKGGRLSPAEMRADGVDQAIKVGKIAPVNAQALSLDDLLKSLAEMAGAKAITPSLPISRSDMPPLEKDGLRAFFINKKTGDIRIASDKQIKNGQTAKNIFGKSSPDDWTVEYHDKSTPRNKVGLDRARTSFAENFDTSRRQTVKPIKVSEAKNESFTPSLVPKLQVAVDTVNAAIKSMSGAPGVDPFFGLLGLGPNFTGKDVLAISDMAQRIPFPGVTKQSLSLMKAIADLEDIVAPNGFRKAEPLRDEAIKSVKTIFAKVPQDVVTPMVDLLGRLADGMAPRVAASDAIPDMALDANSGTILVNAAQRSKATAPQSFTFFHEVGHWAHLNLLSARDRAEFWQWAVDNLPDKNSVRSALGIGPADKMAANQAKMAEYLTAYYSSPSEFFAETFARWATGRIETAANPKMWQRFARYIKGIYDTVIGRKYSVDRDLEKLFLKILPDGQVDEIGDNLDAVNAGAFTPAESVPEANALSADLQPLASDPTIAARPNYMSLPLDDLIEMGDEARIPFIQKLKQVSAALDDAEHLWTVAEDTLEPSAAFDAYRATMRLLIGSTTSLEEKRALLAGVARAKKSQVEPLYSGADEPFSPFTRYLDIVPRSKKMRRMLSLARTGRIQAMDENDLVNLGDMPDVVSSVEAIEAGLHTGEDGSKASAALLEVFRGQTDREKAGLRRMLGDMREALNTAYEQTGVIPQTGFRDEGSAPRELVSHKIGRFSAVTIGDNFKRTDQKGMVWTVEDISGDEVTFRDGNNQILKVKGTELDPFTRFKSGATGKEVEALRQKRIDAAQKLRQQLKRTRIDEARRIANSKIDRLNASTLEANPSAVGAKELATDDLLRRVTSNTDLAEDAADDVVRRELTRPHLPVQIKPTELDDAKESVKSMRQKLLSNDDSVDNDVAALGDEVAITPMAKSVNLAIRSEISEGRGAIEAADVGVPPSASPVMTALLQNIEHRSRPVKYTARTLAYRLLRLANPDNDKAINFVPDAEDWKALRGRVKSLAESYASDGSTERLIERTVSVLYDTNPELKAKLDAMDYSVGDAAELVASVLGETDRVIERGERQIASELLDMTGYLVNGLLRNEHARNAMHRLTYFNDMLTTTSVQDNNGLSLLTSGQVMKLGQLSVDKTGVDAPAMARAGYNEIVMLRGTQFREDGNPIPLDAEIVHSPFDGFTSYLDLPVGNLERTKSGKPRKRTSLRAMPASAFGGDEQKKLALLTAQKADKIRDEILATPEAKRQPLLNALDDHLNVLAELGVAVPNFTVVAVKAKTPFNPSIVIDSAKMVKGLRDSVLDAVEEGEIPDVVGKQIDRTLSAFKLGQTGQQLINDLDKVLTGDFSATDFIAALGYDSLLDKRGRISRVFSDGQLAPVKDFMSQVFYSPKMDFDDAIDSPIGSAVNMSMMAPTATLKSFTPPPGFVMANKADEHGLKHWLLNFYRNRVPRRSDVLTPIRMKHRWLGQNSERMRSGGMVTLGNWFEDHFPWVQQEFGRRLIGTKSTPGPLRAIRSLPDAPSAIKRHLANSTGRNISPESHGKILNALWEPSNPRHEAKLSTDERAALKVIRDSMSKAFFDLKEAGVMMGSRGKNYFPQIWSQRAIRKEPEKAIDAFTKYFEIEALRNGLPTEQEGLRKKATNVVAKLAEVDDQSMWDPDAHAVTTGAAENLDYARKITLDKYPEALKYLKEFLEPDLESYLVKYFDQVSHRLSMAKKFGFRNHGFGDYMSVVVDGRDGIAKLLSSRRTQEHNTFAITPEDGLVDVTFTESFPMPFEANPHKAISAADEVIDIYRKLGPNQARRYLMDLAVPDESRGGRPSTVFERRVDAIVDALRDYGGESKNISLTDAKFLTNSMKLAARRPLISDTTYMVKAAKNLRAFNAITLLSYTTIASLGDAFLPLVRSGDARATMRAWGKYMVDPDYREAMKNIGAGIESLLHNRMTHMTGTPANRFTSAFFNATGLTPWTDEMRSVATAVGLEAFKTAQKKALNAYDPKKPIQMQSTTFRQNFRTLKRYGLESFATNRKAIDAPEFIETDQVRVGLMKFVDDSVFSPNADDIPVWAQTPWGAVLFQLKSFPTMMGRMAREHLYDDVRLAINDKMGRPFDLSDVRGSGNLRRAMYMLTLMPVVGYGINSAMDYIRGRGGDDRTEREAQNRSLSQYMRSLPGFDKNYQQHFGELEHIVDRETLDAFAGQFIAGFATTAGLGIVADMFTNAASQAENGAFGTERMISTIFGPSAGAGISAWHVTQGLLDGNERSSYPERTAMREALRRVPVLGGQNPLVESLINEAIPKTQRRSNSDAKQQPKLFSEE